jgi:O-antigen/teichoic acid export membrane protein
MGLRIKLIKNTSYLTIGSQVGNLLQFLFFLYFARQFGEAVVGQYSFAFSFTYLFSVFADLGLSAYLIREVARDPAEGRQIFADSLILRIVSLAIASFLAAALIAIWFKHFSKETIEIILLLGLFQVFFSIADVFLAELKGHDRMALVALLSILVRLILSGVGIILILLRYDFLQVLACFPVGSLVYLIACLYFSFTSFGRIRFRFHLSGLTGLFIKLLPFAFTIIFVEALHHIDILMLGIFQNDQSVGIYSVAQKMVLIFLGVLVFVHTALLPTFSRFYVESRSKLIDLATQSLRYLVLIGLPLSTGIYAISDKAVLFLFGHMFKDSIPAVNILCWTIAVGYAATIYSVLLTAINRQTAKGISLGICLAFNVILNFILIPKFGYEGAAIAKMSTEVLSLALMSYLVAKYLTSISVGTMVTKPALSCLCMYAVIEMVHTWNLLYLVALAPPIYFVTLALLGGYTKEEAEFLRRLYGRLSLKVSFL